MAANTGKVLANAMKGFASDVYTGMTKGASTASKMKNVTRLTSNMTAAQRKTATQAVKKMPKALKNSGDVVYAGLGKQISKASGQAMSTAQAKQVFKGNVKFRLNGAPSTATKIGDALGGGYRDMYKGMKTSSNTGLKRIGDGFNAGFRNADGKLNGARVAGGFVAASAVGRVATGGGVYKDRYGNTNLIGVPFI